MKKIDLRCNNLSVKVKLAVPLVGLVVPRVWQRWTRLNVGNSAVLL